MQRTGALLYSLGLDEDDIKKPMIAVVNSFTDMVPGLRRYAAMVTSADQGAILRLPE